LPSIYAHNPELEHHVKDVSLELHSCTGKEMKPQYALRLNAKGGKADTVHKKLGRKLHAIDIGGSNANSDKLEIT